LNGLKTKNIYFLVANSALLWVKPIVYFYIKKNACIANIFFIYK
jgi:hypothetical protein